MKLNIFLICFNNGDWVYNDNSVIDLENWLYLDSNGVSYELFNIQNIYEKSSEDWKFKYIKFYDIKYKNNNKIIKEVDMLIRYKEEWITN